MMAEIKLRELTATERQRVNISPVFGYLYGYDKIIPWDEMKVGDTLFIEGCNSSVRRSVKRGAVKAGLWVEASQQGDRGVLFTCRDELEYKKPRATSSSKFHRPWDKALPTETIKLVRRRRAEPDGVRHRVTGKQTAAGYINQYPWSKMQDGDYFDVPIREQGSVRSERQMRNQFRDAACRHDFEISVLSVNMNNKGEEVDGLRVIRVYPGLRKLKLDTIGKASLGRGKKGSPKVRQSTLEKRAVEALVKSGFSESGAWEMINTLKEKKNAEAGSGNEGVPAPVQRGERDAREEHRQDRGSPGRGSLALQEGDVPDRGGNRRVREVVNIFDTGGDEDSESCAPEGGEPDAGGEVHLHPVRPDEPETLGGVQGRRTYQPRPVPEGNARKADPERGPGGNSAASYEGDGGRVSEIRVHEGETLDLARLKGTAYDPEYDRAAIMRARIARLAGEE